MKYLLDTNILIYLIKNKPPSVARRIDALGEDAVLGMSFFTYAELLKGAERSLRKPEVLRRLEQLTRQVPVAYQASRSLCEHYAAQFTRLNAHFSDRGRLFQADRGRQIGAAVGALGKHASPGLNVAQSSTISLKPPPGWATMAPVLH